MKIINGQKIADQILADLKKEIKAKKLKLCLAVILVGDESASHLYVRLKEKAARRVGIRVKKHFLPEDVSGEEILEIIKSLNADAKVNGILVQFPLPSKISADKIVQAIEPKKDVDGFLKESRFTPPFVLSIWQAIASTNEDLKTKKAVALVNSDIFGQTLCSFLGKKGLKCEYLIEATTQTIKLKNPDILITALGLPNFIKGSMIKQGAILIDGGISQKGGKVVGDINEKSVSSKAAWLSPVPGGLGPMTVAFLLKNVALATVLRLYAAKGGAPSKD